MKKITRDKKNPAGSNPLPVLAGIFLGVLLFMATAFVAHADPLCLDCHGVLGPHTQCGNTSNCETCHPAFLPNKTGKLDTIQHPSGPGTPMENVSLPGGITDACATCHMLDPAVTHPYRINTNPSTTTGYPDVDWVCGQCHGGGTNIAVTPSKPGVVYFTKLQLAGGAKNIHNNPAVTNPMDCLQCHGKGGIKPAADQINHPNWAATPGAGSEACRTCHLANGPVHQTLPIDVQKVCGQCHGGSNGINATTTGAPYKTAEMLDAIAKSMHYAANDPPIVSHQSLTVNLYTVSFTDTSTDPDGTSNVVKVNWGDGSLETLTSGATFTHTYHRAKTYSIYHSVDDGLAASQEVMTVSVPRKFSITGTINLDGVVLVLKRNGHTRTKTTSVNNHYSFTKIIPGTYTIMTFVNGYVNKTIGPFTVLSSDVQVDITM